MPIQKFIILDNWCRNVTNYKALGLAKQLYNLDIDNYYTYN